MTITSAHLIRWTGLAAVLGGLIFAAIQPIHPPDVVSSVTSGALAIITPLKTMMCLLMLIGVTGIYARQVTRVGWLGLIGFLIFSLAWAITYGDVFAETVILPPLAAAAPQFVDSMLGIGAGRVSPVDLGVFPTLFALAGGLYMLGGLLLGIATFRAGILPRWAAGLMASTAFLTPAAAVLPHQFQRLAAVPMGVALAGLGYALWTERRAHALDPVSRTEASPLRTSTVE